MSMYHIKNDKRTKNSAKLFGEAMLRLLHDKEFDKVSVSDLTRESGCGRTTFYRLFDNTADVLAYLCDKTMEMALAAHRRTRVRGARDVMLLVIREWMHQETLLHAVVRSGRTDVLLSPLKAHAAEAAELFFPGVETAPEQQEYAISLFAMGLAGALETWEERGEQESPEQVYELVYGSVEIFYLMTHPAAKPRPLAEQPFRA